MGHQVATLVLVTLSYSWWYTCTGICNKGLKWCTKEVETMVKGKGLNSSKFFMADKGAWMINDKIQRKKERCLGQLQKKRCWIPTIICTEKRVGRCIRQRDLIRKDHTTPDLLSRWLQIKTIK